MKEDHSLPAAPVGHAISADTGSKARRTPSRSAGAHGTGTLAENTSQRNSGAPKSRWRWRNALLGTGEGQWLAMMIVAILLLLLGTAFWSMTGGNDEVDDSFTQASWLSWGLFFDPGTQTGIAADAPFRVKSVALVFSVLGFIFNLVLLGLIVDQVRSRLSRWKTKFSHIAADDHTLLLGWGPRTLFLLSELLQAYEEKRQHRQLREGSRRCCCRCLPYRCCSRRRKIVVLATEDPLFMEEEAKAHLQSQDPPDRRSRCAKFFGPAVMEGIYFRTGDPTDWRELGKVSPCTAGDIIILGTQNDSEDSDNEVLQTLLALASLGDITGEVWAEMRIAENVNVANMVLPEAQGIFARQAVNRMLCLRALQPAIGLCTLDMISFMSGDQIYLVPDPDLGGVLQSWEPQLVGQTFAHASRCFPCAVLIGVRKKGQAVAEVLAPRPDTVLEQDHILVLLAQDRNDAEKFNEVGGGARHVDAPLIRSSNSEIMKPPEQAETADHVVICMIGCPKDFSDLLHIMHLMLPPESEESKKSEVWILSERSVQWRQEQFKLSYATDNMNNADDIGNRFGNIHIEHVEGPTTSSRHIRKMPLDQASCVLILSEAHSETEDPTASDSRNLNTVCTLFNIDPGERPGDHCQVICELLDPRSEYAISHFSKKPDTVRLADLCTYFYSNKMETSMFAMASEESAVFNILQELLQPQSAAVSADHSGGVDILSVPPADILYSGAEKLTFWELHDRVLQKTGGILIGWGRRDEDDGHERLRVNVNPTRRPQANGLVSSTMSRRPSDGADVEDSDTKETKLEWRQDRTGDVLLVIRQDRIAGTFHDEQGDAGGSGKATPEPIIIPGSVDA